MTSLLEVYISKKAVKDLKRVPWFIQDKLNFWVRTVTQIGLFEAMKIKGFHDEPLKGVRSGQRSIRLSRSYRAIYKIENKTVKFIEVLEVNKHEY